MMNEKQWLKCCAVDEMLRFLWRLRLGKFGTSRTSLDRHALATAVDRKLRLFACATVRQWGGSGPGTGLALEVAECYADGKATQADLKDAERAVVAGVMSYVDDWYGIDQDLMHHAMLVHPDIAPIIERFAECMLGINPFIEYGMNPFVRVYRKWRSPRPRNENEVRCCRLLREIFGNPFRPAEFDPVWRTAAVTAVAQAIYDENRFADMPVLADALEESGCTSSNLLDHCRGGAPHVRGCWALDRVLGKEVV